VTRLRWRDPPLPPVDLPYGGRLQLRLSVGSGLARRPNDPPGRVWGLGDRGPNLKVRTALAHPSLSHLAPLKAHAGAKILPLPDFQPMLAELQVEDDQVTLMRPLPLRSRAGPLSGRPPPQPSGHDMEPVFDLLGAPVADDPDGCDPEGLAALSGGGFWVSEEYGPGILRIGADGVVQSRWTPPGAERRRLNRGIEGLCVSDDERWLYVGFQSGFQGEALGATAIWKLDAATGAPAATYDYPFDSPQSFRRDAATGADASDLKVCELVWLGSDRLLVLERISLDARLYVVGVSRPGLLAKTLVFSTDDHPEIAPDVEGVARLDGRTLLLATDNDFGTEGAETAFYRIAFDAEL